MKSPSNDAEPRAQDKRQVRIIVHGAPRRWQAAYIERESEILTRKGAVGARWAVHDGGHVTQDRTVARMVLLGAVRVASRSVNLSESI